MGPRGLTPPGSSVHEISQARILEWVAIFLHLPDPRIKPVSPALAGIFFFTPESPGKLQIKSVHLLLIVLVVRY